MNRPGRVGLLILAGFLFLALSAEWIAPYPAGETDYQRVLAGPSAAHPMGTDHLGRDLLSRLMVGSRVTLGLASIIALFSAGVALLLGSFAGFLGGWFDTLVMRMVDSLMALPGFLLAICFLGIAGGGLFQLALFLVLTGWVQMCRVVRNEIAIVKSQDFITANTSVGYSKTRNALRHALPMVLPSLLVIIVTTLIGDIFAIVSLSFLGLGVSPQIPEWGAILFDAREYLLASPWLLLFPSLCIGLVSTGLYLAADGLRDRLDTKRNLFVWHAPETWAATTLRVEDQQL